MKKKKTVAMILVLLVLLVALLSYAKNAVENNLEALSKVSPSSFDMSKVKDGVFRGSSSALPVAATVEVHIENKKITQIVLLKHFNGRGTSGEGVLDLVLEQQDVNVDTVSGATYSSVIILKAVEEALNQSAAKQ